MWYVPTKNTLLSLLNYLYFCLFVTSFVFGAIVFVISLYLCIPPFNPFSPRPLTFNFFAASVCDMFIMYIWIQDIIAFEDWYQDIFAKNTSKCWYKQKIKPANYWLWIRAIKSFKLSLAFNVAILVNLKLKFSLELINDFLIFQMHHQIADWNSLNNYEQTRDTSN